MAFYKKTYSGDIETATHHGFDPTKLPIPSEYHLDKWYWFTTEEEMHFTLGPLTDPGLKVQTLWQKMLGGIKKWMQNF